MSDTRFSGVLWILLLSVVSLGAAAKNAAGRVPLGTGSGIPEFDLPGDGTPATAVVGRRENFNAHSFNIISF